MKYEPSTKVSDILKTKRGGIKNAPLEQGSPTWDDIQNMTWGEIEDGTNKGLPGYRTIRKLLTDSRFEK